MIERIGVGKLLFGSDVPWGDYEDEINIFNSVNIEKIMRNKIAFENLIKALSLANP